jgi:hypothetical protein
MPSKIVPGLPKDLLKKHKLDKPYLQKVTVSDLQRLQLALMERAANQNKTGRACNTCCCCCAAAVELD